MLMDVAESLVRQGVQRLVVLNFHGGNEFKPLVRDVMFEFPIFIVQVHGHQLAPDLKKQTLEEPGDHADEFETSLLLHLRSEWVNLEAAGNGAKRFARAHEYSRRLVLARLEGFNTRHRCRRSALSNRRKRASTF